MEGLEVMGHTIMGEESLKDHIFSLLLGGGGGSAEAGSAFEGKQVLILEVEERKNAN